MFLLLPGNFLTIHLFSDPQTSAGCAPSVLITFINMMLSKHPDYPPPPSPNGTDANKIACNPYMYAGQSFFESVLLLCALCCIPWMLFAKPYKMIQERKAKHMQVYIVKFFSYLKKINFN